jgi:Protein of unknown function (DUF3531)
MQVEFREFNPFDLWIWIEFETTPSEQEKLYAGLELNYLDYNESSDSMMALMHNMGNFEYEGYWGRCWFDLGTSDAIALDVLLNALVQFSKDFVHLERIFIGGENEDWPIEGSESKPFYEDND